MTDTDLTWRLRNLVGEVPGTRWALVVSDDGIRKWYYGMNSEQAEHAGAVASGLWMLAKADLMRPAATTPTESVKQLIIEKASMLHFLAAAGTGSVISVAADRTVDSRMISYAVKTMCEELPTLLDTASRLDSGIHPEIIVPGAAP